MLITEAKATDERMRRTRPALRAATTVLDIRSVDGIDDGSQAHAFREATGRRRSGPGRNGRRWRLRPLWIGAASLIFILVLAAGVLTGAVPWPQSPAGNPDYRTSVPRPFPEELERAPDHCANRTAVVDTADGEASGSIRLRECADTIEISIADLDRDSRCVYAEFVWPGQFRERSERACPVGDIVTQRYTKRADDYQIELISTYTP
jgi:hypothetical protein